MLRISGFEERLAGIHTEAEYIAAFATDVENLCNIDINSWMDREYKKTWSYKIHVWFPSEAASASVSSSSSSALSAGSAGRLT